MTRFVTSRTDQRREMALHFDHNETETPSDELRREHVLCASVMEDLQRFYPGYAWAIRVAGGGVDANGRKKPKGVEIKLPVLMPPNKSYVIPAHMLMKDVNTSTRLVREAGGHILERYNIPRTGFTLDPFLIARRAHLIQDHKSKVPE